MNMSISCAWRLFGIALLLGKVASFAPTHSPSVVRRPATVTRSITTPTQLYGAKSWVSRLLKRGSKHSQSQPDTNDETLRAHYVHQALVGRRTVNKFLPSPTVDDAVVEQAMEAAICAPCHKMTEPWRFILLGPETVKAIATLNAAKIAQSDPVKGAAKQKRWETIPGWCVVTCAKSEDPVQAREDYAATSCAVQNFMLSLWSQNVGTKWTSGPITRTPEFANLCGIDLEKEDVVGCIWYGYASDGLESVRAPPRKRSVAQVTSRRP